jgi:hypothetical protein
MAPVPLPLKLLLVTLLPALTLQPWSSTFAVTLSEFPEAVKVNDGLNLRSPVAEVHDTVPVPSVAGEPAEALWTPHIVTKLIGVANASADSTSLLRIPMSPPKDVSDWLLHHLVAGYAPAGTVQAIGGSSCLGTTEGALLPTNRAEMMTSHPSVKHLVNLARACEMDTWDRCVCCRPLELPASSHPSKGTGRRGPDTPPPVCSCPSDRAPRRATPQAPGSALDTLRAPRRAPCGNTQVAGK